jgi:uncharacterized membrane protein
MTVGILAHVRRRLVRGVILVLPLLITVWLLGLLFDLINRNVTPLVRTLLELIGIPGSQVWFARIGIPLVSLVLTVLFIYLLGLIGGNVVARRALALVESLILRIPLVKGIYGSARQLLNAFSFSSTRAFSKVVLVEYPRRGVWTFGFVTTDVEHRLQHADETVATVPVFLPTTPNPTSGWMMLVPTFDLRIVDISIEDAIKLIVSGGIVSPQNLGSLVREWPGDGTSSDAR